MKKKTRKQLKFNNSPAFLKLLFLKICFTKLTTQFWKAFLEGLSARYSKGGDTSSVSMLLSASSLTESATTAQKLTFASGVLECHSSYLGI